MVELLFALLTTLTGISRTVDPDLTALAQRRAVEITTNFSHQGVPPNTAEIIAWNSNPDPVTRLALQWQGSPPHWAILTDPRYTRWGCGIYQKGAAFYGVCLFRGGTASIAPAASTPPTPTPPVQLLPDAAMETSMSSDTIRTVATYLTALVVIVGGGILIVIPTQLDPNTLLPFLTGAIGTVLGYVFGERTASSAVANQPTVTTSAGPPPTTTITPAGDQPIGPTGGIG